MELFGKPHDGMYLYELQQDGRGTTRGKLLKQ
jgi:hypothetical protein